jgi:hypothetical protein
VYLFGCGTLGKGSVVDARRVLPFNRGHEEPVILVANALLGISQGFTWSTTVITKIDLRLAPCSRALRPMP